MDNLQKNMLSYLDTAAVPVRSFHSHSLDTKMVTIKDYIPPVFSQKERLQMVAFQQGGAK